MSLSKLRCDETFLRDVGRNSIPPALQTEFDYFEERRASRFAKYESLFDPAGRLSRPANSFSCLSSALQMHLVPENSFEIDVDWCCLTTLAIAIRHISGDSQLASTLEGFVSNKKVIRSRAHPNPVEAKKKLAFVSCFLTPFAEPSRGRVNTYHRESDTTRILHAVYSSVLEIVLHDCFGRLHVPENISGTIVNVLKSHSGTPEALISLAEELCNNSPFTRTRAFPLETLFPTWIMPNLSCNAASYCHEDQTLRAYKHKFSALGKYLFTTIFPLLQKTNIDDDEPIVSWRSLVDRADSTVSVRTILSQFEHYVENNIIGEIVDFVNESGGICLGYFYDGIIATWKEGFDRNELVQKLQMNLLSNLGTSSITVKELTCKSSVQSAKRPMAELLHQKSKRQCFEAPSPQSNTPSLYAGSQSPYPYSPSPFPHSDEDDNVRDSVDSREQAVPDQEEAVEGEVVEEEAVEDNSNEESKGKQGKFLREMRRLILVHVKQNGSFRTFDPGNDKKFGVTYWQYYPGTKAYTNLIHDKRFVYCSETPLRLVIHQIIKSVDAEWYKKYVFTGKVAPPTLAKLETWFCNSLDDDFPFLSHTAFNPGTIIPYKDGFLLLYKLEQAGLRNLHMSNLRLDQVFIAYDDPNIGSLCDPETGHFPICRDLSHLKESFEVHVWPQLSQHDVLGNCQVLRMTLFRQIEKKELGPRDTMSPQNWKYAKLAMAAYGSSITLGEVPFPRALLLEGPSGYGKSSAIRPLNNWVPPEQKAIVAVNNGYQFSEADFWNGTGFKRVVFNADMKRGNIEDAIPSFKAILTSDPFSFDVKNKDRQHCNTKSPLFWCQQSGRRYDRGPGLVVVGTNHADSQGWNDPGNPRRQMPITFTMAPPKNGPPIDLEAVADKTFNVEMLYCLWYWGYIRGFATRKQNPNRLGPHLSLNNYFIIEDNVVLDQDYIRIIDNKIDEFNNIHNEIGPDAESITWLNNYCEEIIPNLQKLAEGELNQTYHNRFVLVEDLFNRYKHGMEEQSSPYVRQDKFVNLVLKAFSHVVLRASKTNNRVRLMKEPTFNIQRRESHSRDGVDSIRKVAFEYLVFKSPEY